MDEASAAPMARVETSQNAEADFALAETNELVHTPLPAEVLDCKMMEEPQKKPFNWLGLLIDLVKVALAYLAGDQIGF